MTWWTAVLPVVTLVLGYVGTIWTESRRDARAAVLAREQRNDELSASHRAERRVFELDTLRDCTEAIQAMARAAAKAHHFDVMQARERGVDVYPSSLLPDGLSDELHAATVRVHMLKGMLLDDATRQTVHEFSLAVGDVVTLTEVTVAEGEAALRVAMERYDDAQDAVTGQVRAIYRGSVTTS